MLGSNASQPTGFHLRHCWHHVFWLHLFALYWRGRWISHYSDEYSQITETIESNLSLKTTRQILTIAVSLCPKFCGKLLARRFAQQHIVLKQSTQSFFLGNFFSSQNKIMTRPGISIQSHKGTRNGPAHYVLHLGWYRNGTAVFDSTSEPRLNQIGV